MLKTGNWTVDIAVGNDRIVARVTNDKTRKACFYERVYADFEDGPRYKGYDEAIGECLTAVRDTFDKV